MGSALGLTVVEDPAGITSAALGAFDHGDRILLERYVDGTDVSVALYGADLSALPSVEIRSRSKVFDFDTRMSPGAFEFVCPPSMPDDAIRRVAIDVAALMGIRDFGRIDIRIDDEGPTVLDIKTCPGLTESSILPFAATQADVPFDDFVATVVGNALQRAAVAQH
jgi:D-alanine-D-alanine ligase